jgi:putative FmdB family regulatory protein
MPVYEYLCDTCGPFTEMRAMSEFRAPCDCPECAAPAPRVLLTAPNFACTPAHERKARDVNERSRHAPMTLDQYKAKASHGAGCGCCSGKPSRWVAKTRDGAKSFPTARPWMISH